MSFQYGGEPLFRLDLRWFVSCAVLRGKSPLEQETDRGSGMASESRGASAVLALGVPSARADLDHRLGLGPGGREPAKEPVASGRLE